MAEIKQLLFWKHLTNFWGWLTLLVFITAFFYPEQFNGVLSNIAVIYTSILGIYVGSKEIARWRNKKKKASYHGELFIAIWTIIIVGMIIISVVNKEYAVPSQFVATYITILGIFAISQKSKALRG